LVSLPFSFIRHMVIMYSAVRQIVFQLLPIFACWHITWLHCLNSIMMASGNVANASYTDGYIIYYRLYFVDLLLYLFCYLLVRNYSRYDLICWGFADGSISFNHYIICVRNTYKKEIGNFIDWIQIYLEEEFEDTKGVIRTRKSKGDKQDNG
jgi:hypothetical protein